MKSGLEDRNNLTAVGFGAFFGLVSMKSGLEDRNNVAVLVFASLLNELVSMKSGLEDRNNGRGRSPAGGVPVRLNEVRPGRPEQSWEGIKNWFSKVWSQ